MFGWYSKQAADRFGHWVFITPDGKKVLCTETTQGCHPTSKWDDLVFVGKVSQCLQRSKWERDWDKLSVEQLIEAAMQREAHYEKELLRKQIVSLHPRYWN